MKLNIVNSLAVFFFLIFSASCNNPLQKTYSPSSYEKDIQEIRGSGKINDDEVAVLVKYIFLARVAGNDLTGQTYKDILNKVKTFQQKNDELESTKEMERDARRNRLLPHLEAGLLKKEYSNNEGKEVMIYTVTLKNISSQKIKTIAGNFLLNDLLGKPVTQLNIFVDEEIKPGLTLTKTIKIPYHNADFADQRIRGKDLVDMRVIWNPEKIILENGSLLQ